MRLFKAGLIIASQTLRYTYLVNISTQKLTLLFRKVV